VEKHIVALKRRMQAFSFNCFFLLQVKKWSPEETVFEVWKLPDFLFLRKLKKGSFVSYLF
jgi:hypothetical protein